MTHFAPEFLSRNIQSIDVSVQGAVVKQGFLLLVGARQAAEGRYSNARPPGGTVKAAFDLMFLSRWNNCVRSLKSSYCGRTELCKVVHIIDGPEFLE